MSGGGQSVAAPTPTPQETALQQAQADNIAKQTSIMQQQYHDQQLLAPILYKQAGLNPTYDSSGNLTGFSQDPNQTALTQQTQQIQSQLNQRELDALNGNAPIDPDMQRQLDLSSQTLNQSLEANLGPGYATSTPGIQALNDFAQRKASLIYGAKTGQLSTYEQLQLANQQGQNTNLSTTLGALSGINQGPLASVSGFGQVNNSAAGAIQGWQNNQAMTLQNAQFNSNQAFQGTQNTMGGVGALAGTAMTAAAIFF